MLLATSVYAAGLRMPVFLRFNGKLVSAKTLNQTFKATGANKIPELFAVPLDYVGFQKASYEYWNELPERVMNFNSTYKQNVRLVMENYPGELVLGDLQTCYEGSVSEVIETIYAMTDLNYSEDLSLMAIKQQDKYILERTYLREYSSSVSAQKFIEDHFKGKLTTTSTRHLRVFVSLSGEFHDQASLQTGEIVPCKGPLKSGP
jgi:hypothetical protein